jgi:hypothetical protein
MTRFAATASTYLDEYAHRREAWTEVLQPALADRHDRALFIGITRGLTISMNWSSAETHPDWKASISRRRGGNVSREELASAAKWTNAPMPEFNATLRTWVWESLLCFRPRK